MDTAKDIVQDAFEVLWKNKEIVKTEKVKQYLFTVAYRKGVDIFRKQKYNESLDEVHNEIREDEGIEAIYSDKDTIVKAIQYLPEEYRKLLLLRDLEGYTYKEIEGISGLNENKVKVYLFRARKMLREAIIKFEIT